MIKFIYRMLLLSKLFWNQYVRVILYVRKLLFSMIFFYNTHIQDKIKQLKWVVVGKIVFFVSLSNNILLHIPEPNLLSELRWKHNYDVLRFTFTSANIVKENSIVCKVILKYLGQVTLSNQNNGYVVIYVLFVFNEVNFFGRLILLLFLTYRKSN